MKLTERDIRLVKDVCLSHVLCRDQIMNLGYFSSVGRTNTRLRELVTLKALRVADTPFFTQHLYVAGPSAAEIVGERIAAIVRSRAGTPRFIQHALALTDIRISLTAQPGNDWRFEQQIRDGFIHAGKNFEFKPDGCVISEGTVTFVEADLGHVNRPRMREKVMTLRTYRSSGRFCAVYGERAMQCLVVTTGSLRKSHLVDIACEFPDTMVRIVTFHELGLRVPGGWS